jgi:cytochrome c oxidase assembly factor CtaG
MPLIAWVALGLLVWLEGAPAALAHTGQPPTPQDVWTVWNWSLGLWLGFALAGSAYARGWLRLEQHHQPPGLWRTVCFAGGLLLAFVALITPLDAASSALLSAHMVQHMLLIMGTAPLLAISQPLGPLLLGLPRPLGQRMGRAWRGSRWLRRAWQVLSHPALGGLLLALALWGWHLPPAYQGALGNQWVHDAEHLSFLGISLIFWWGALEPARHDTHAIAASFLAIFATGLQSTVLALLFMISAQPWYPAYLVSTPAWGLNPLQDQQLAGAIMWAPAAVVNLGAIVGLLAVWLRTLDRHTHQQQPDWLRRQEQAWER